MDATPTATTHALDAQGAVRDWLLAGPWSSPAPSAEPHVDRSGDPFGDRGRWLLSKNPEADGVKLAMLGSVGVVVPPAVLPVEDATISWGSRRGVWRRTHVDGDGYVDWSGFAFTPQLQEAVAACVLRVSEDGTYELQIASTGSLGVRVDGRCVHQDLFVATQRPVERSIPVRLRAGDHAVVIAGRVLGMREYRHVLRLAVSGAATVGLPTLNADPAATEQAEALLDAIGLERRLSCDGRWTLTGPSGSELVVEHDGRRDVVSLDGGRGVWSADPGAADESETTSSPRRGRRVVRISTPVPAASAARDWTLIEVPSDYRGEPLGEADAWTEEFLRHAVDAGRGMAGQLARLQLGATRVDAEAVAHSIRSVNERGDCADFEVVALVNLWRRARPQAWPGDLREQVAVALRRFKYWLDEPGLDCMCYFTENHQLVFHVGELLAGELFPTERFSNDGVTGREHAERAGRRCAAWLAQRLRDGFTEFDSNTYFAIDVLALVSLIEFARSAVLREKATAVLDLLWFQLACNSWRGIHGCSHARSYAEGLLSGRLEETAPLQRLAWGTGTLNESVLPAVVFAAAQRYRVPSVVVAAGTHTPQRWQGVQRSTGSYDFERDLRRGRWAASSMVFKTPEGMLASLQDYRAGQPGYQEHIWQATLGPDTAVFAQHPANSSISSSARPNYWAGNAVLPRVRQHDDALIALYDLRVGNGLGFTHAWFPATTMDAWREHDGWLVGCVEDGYVALTSDGSLRLRERGVSAGQEAHVEAGGEGWVCQLGRRAEHGSLSAFCDALARPSFGGRSAQYRTLNGQVLELGWNGPFRVDGRPAESPEDYPRLRNPLTETAHGAERLRMRLNGDVHELDLSQGRRVSTGTEQDR